MSTRILVIDDEESFCEVLKRSLEREGWDVDTADSAETALTYDLTQYNLMIVDIMMEKMSGFDFAKKVRNNPETDLIPIIFCSALNGEDEIVKGLNIGADDYITKPYIIGEVVARVRAVLRRSKLRAASQPTTVQGLPANPKADNPNYEPDIIYKNLRIDRNEKICFINNNPISLSRREFNLLLFFLINRDRTHSREEIMKQVWKDEIVTTRAVDTNIARLRKKIEPYGENIVTRLGFGYTFKTDM